MAARTRVPVPGERIAAEFVDNVTDIGRKRAALLVCGSLAAKPLPESCADLCLTDPPYFSNVQYSELMDYLYAWLASHARDTILRRRHVPLNR